MAAAGTIVGGAIYLSIGLVPVFLGLVGPLLLPISPDAEQIVAKLAEVYLPGVLYVAFAGAIISAILSAVHSALHAPASQISHNILCTDYSQAQRGWQALGRTHDGDGPEHHRLSDCSQFGRYSRTGETASAFGSAGVFVATLFALFTRFGGPASAYASIVAGMALWAAGEYLLGLTAPICLA